MKIVFLFFFFVSNKDNENWTIQAISLKKNQ